MQSFLGDCPLKTTAWEANLREAEPFSDLNKQQLQQTLALQIKIAKLFGINFFSCSFCNLTIYMCPKVNLTDVIIL